METSPRCNSVTGHQIATNFCTCHDSTAITVLESRWEWNEISIEFNCDGKPVSETGPRSFPSTHKLFNATLSFSRKDRPDRSLPTNYSALHQINRTMPSWKSSPAQGQGRKFMNNKLPLEKTSGGRVVRSWAMYLINYVHNDLTSKWLNFQTFDIFEFNFWARITKHAPCLHLESCGTCYWLTLTFKVIFKKIFEKCCIFICLNNNL